MVRNDKALTRMVAGYRITLARRCSRVEVASWCPPGGGEEATRPASTRLDEARRGSGASSAAAEAARQATGHPPHHVRAHTILMTPTRCYSKNCGDFHVQSLTRNDSKNCCDFHVQSLTRCYNKNLL